MYICTCTCSVRVAGREGEVGIEEERKSEDGREGGRGRERCLGGAGGLRVLWRETGGEGEGGSKGERVKESGMEEGLGRDGLGGWREEREGGREMSPTQTVPPPPPPFSLSPDQTHWVTAEC